MSFGGIRLDRKRYLANQIEQTTKTNKQFGSQNLKNVTRTSRKLQIEKNKDKSFSQKGKTFESFGVPKKKISPFDPKLNLASQTGFLKIRQSPNYESPNFTFLPTLCFYPLEQSLNSRDYNTVFDIFGNFYAIKKINRDEMLTIPPNYKPAFESKAFLQFDKFESLKYGSDIKKNDVSYFLKFCRIKKDGNVIKLQKTDAFEKRVDVSNERKIKPGEFAHQFFNETYFPKHNYYASGTIEAGSLLKNFPESSWTDNCAINWLFNKNKTEESITIFRHQSNS